MTKIKIVRTLMAFLWSALASAAEDISIDNPRPLMVLCATLHERHGALITYEDAPADSIKETNIETRPNGRVFKSPRSSPITFHLSPDLPDQSELSDPAFFSKGSVDSFAAVSKAVEQYNSTGNPGRFSVRADETFIHVQQTMRTINGRLEPFEPISNRVLAGWPSTMTTSCAQILSQLSGALQTQYGISIVQGSIPVSPLLAHSCSV